MTVIVVPKKLKVDTLYKLDDKIYRCIWVDNKDSFLENQLVLDLEVTYTKVS